MKPHWKGRIVWTVALVLALLGMGSPGFSQPAQLIFLRVEGVQGESQESNHMNWIDAEGYSHRVWAPAGGGGAGAVRSVHEALFVRKRLDKATPHLFRLCCLGQVVTTVTLQLHINNGGTNPKFMEIALGNVQVTSVSTIRTPLTDARPVEEVGFSYEKIRWTYLRYDPAGMLVETITTTWNVATNGPTMATARRQVMKLE